MNKNTSSLSYTDQGKGPAVVLLHGLCESKEIWLEFVENLSTNFRIICVDIPGFGESPLNGEVPTMEFYAACIHETLQHLNLGKFVLAGHSLGGYIALAYEENYANELCGLVLFHSSALPDTEEKKADRNKTIEFVRKNGAEAFGKVLIPTLFTSENYLKFRDKIKGIYKMAANASVEGIIGSLIAMRDRIERTEVLKNTGNPVLFIIGKEDKAVPLEASLKQCHLPSESVAYFLSKTAHMGMIEKLKETLGIFKDFIDLCQTKL